MNPYSIHPDTMVGPLSLTVQDLKRSEEFYRDVLGFKPLPRRDGTISLTADGKSPILQPTEDPPGWPGLPTRPACSILRF